MCTEFNKKDPCYTQRKTCTYVCVKRDLCMCQKETCICAKSPAIYIYIHIYIYVYIQRKPCAALLEGMCQTRPMYVSKETYVYVKRVQQKRFVPYTEATLRCLTRGCVTKIDVCMCQKRPIYVQRVPTKETYTMHTKNLNTLAGPFSVSGTLFNTHYITLQQHTTTYCNSTLQQHNTTHCNSTLQQHKLTHS